VCSDAGELLHGPGHPVLGPACHQRRAGFRGDVHQPGVRERPDEPRAEVGIASDDGEGGLERANGPLVQRGMLWRVGVMRQRRGHDPAEVDGFQHQPAARPDGRDHALERAPPVRDVLQDGTCVRQVEGGFLQRVGQDVVLADVEVGPAVPVKETRVKIDGGDPPGAAHPSGQPQRDASRAESDLQAVPAVAHAQIGQALRGVAVKQRLNPAQPIAFLSQPWSKTY
jgi:hypothetical protein